MSTTWDVYCADCSDGHGLDSCRRPDGVIEIIRAQTAIAALAPFSSTLRVGLEYDSDSLHIGWFVEHGGHRLVARNGYGDILDPTGELTMSSVDVRSALEDPARDVPDRLATRLGQHDLLMVIGTLRAKLSKK